MEGPVDYRYLLANEHAIRTGSDMHPPRSTGTLTVAVVSSHSSPPWSSP